MKNQLAQINADVYRKAESSPTRPPEQFKTVDTDLHFSRKFATQAPKMINISKADIEQGCIDIRFWIKDIENERDLEKLQRESNWTAYQEALRLLNQAETQRDELLAAAVQAERELEEGVMPGVVAQHLRAVIRERY